MGVLSDAGGCVVRCELSIDRRDNRIRREQETADYAARGLPPVLPLLNLSALVLQLRRRRLRAVSAVLREAHAPAAPRGGGARQRLSAPPIRTQTIILVPCHPKSEGVASKRPKTANVPHFLELAPGAHCAPENVGFRPFLADPPTSCGVSGLSGLLGLHLSPPPFSLCAIGGAPRASAPLPRPPPTRARRGAAGAWDARVTRVARRFAESESESDDEDGGTMPADGEAVQPQELSDRELGLLRAEFLRLMQERFLAGLRLACPWLAALCLATSHVCHHLRRPLVFVLGLRGQGAGFGVSGWG